MMIGLASTLHDPSGAMVPLLTEALPQLVNLYGRLVIAVTDATSAEVTLRLDAYPTVTRLPGSHHVGASRRAALQKGLDFAELTHFHYCDFDRLLHWWWRYPAELRATLKRLEASAGFVGLGRTERAFATHPIVQRENEYLTNRVFSWVYGRGVDSTVVDVVAGSCAMCRPSAETVVAHSTEQSNATDCEWPLLIARLTSLPVAFDVKEGLEFETPTFFGQEVYALSHDADNWRKRVQLARQSIEAALRIDDAASPAEQSSIGLSRASLADRLQCFMEEIWNRGDFGRINELVAPQYRVTHDPGDPWDGQTLNHAQFEQRVRYSRSAFPDLRFDIHKMVTEANTVVARWTMSGTHLGDLPQLPATGRPFSISGMTFYAFESGKVAGHIQSFDRLGFLAQIGFLG